MRLVSEDPHQTAQALARANLHFQIGPVVLVGLRESPGIFARVGQLLAADGIPVSYSYVSWTSRREGFAVFKTADDERAMLLLQMNALMETLAAEEIPGVSRRTKAHRPMAVELAA